MFWIACRSIARRVFQGPVAEVTVPATHAAEMEPFNALMGEFRAHFAGFLDPGLCIAEAAMAALRCAATRCR